MDFVAFQNNIIPKESLNFYSLERFRFSDACFESIIFINGSFPLLAYHQKRLDKTTAFLGFEPYEISENLLLEVLHRNSLEKNNARIRLSLVRKNGRNYSPYGKEVEALVEAEPTNIALFTSINKLGTYKEFTKTKNIISSFKTSSALGYVLAKKYAEEQGLNEVLISNTNGDWIEAASSNLFVIKDGIIYTSADDSACVLGVVRNFIIEHFSVCFVRIDKEFLLAANEIFLTNGINLVQSVLSFEGKTLENRLTQELQEKIKTLLLI